MDWGGVYQCVRYTKNDHSHMPLLPLFFPAHWRANLALFSSTLVLLLTSPHLPLPLVCTVEDRR